MALRCHSVRLITSQPMIPTPVPVSFRTGIYTNAWSDGTMPWQPQTCSCSNSWPLCMRSLGSGRSWSSRCNRCQQHCTAPPFSSGIVCTNCSTRRNRILLVYKDRKNSEIWLIHQRTCILNLVLLLYQPEVKVWNAQQLGDLLVKK